MAGFVPANGGKYWADIVDEVDEVDYNSAATTELYEYLDIKHADRVFTRILKIVNVVQGRGSPTIPMTGYETFPKGPITKIVDVNQIHDGWTFVKNTRVKKIVNVVQGRGMPMTPNKMKKAVVPMAPIKKIVKVTRGGNDVPFYG